MLQIILKNNLNLLRKYGVLLALDDFGCGLSNLKQLCDIAPDSIKVDKEFISGVLGHAEEILKFILALARTRNIPVIAEGVETQEGAQGIDKYWYYKCTRLPVSEAITL